MTPISAENKRREDEMPHCERCDRIIKDNEDDNGYGLCPECYDDYMDEKADCEEDDDE